MRLQLRLPPLLLWVILAGVTLVAAPLTPSLDAFFPGQAAVALALLVTGVAFAVAGVVEFRRAKTTVNPLAPHRASTVVRTGVFALSRNPMYLGMACALLGVALWTGSLVGVLLVPVFCVYMTCFQIQPEEEALLALFGQEFRHYMSQVRRWI